MATKQEISAAIVKSDALHKDLGDLTALYSMTQGWQGEYKIYQQIKYGIKIATSLPHAFKMTEWNDKNKLRLAQFAVEALEHKNIWIWKRRIANNTFWLHIDEELCEKWFNENI